MKKAIRIISILLIMSMLFSMPLSAANVEKQDIDGEFSDILDFLIMFGLEKYNEDGTFSIDANVTRAEFSVMIGRMLGLDSAIEGTGAQTNFSDVPPEHFASNCIQTLTSMGLINGQSDGTFAPDRVILCDEALKIVLCALGYEQVAQSKGGYPAGYYAAASNAGLLEGVSLSHGAPITREQMDRLIYNALHSEFYKEVSYGNTVTYEKQAGVILLNDVFDVYKETGVVTATELSSIGEEYDLEDGTAEIDGILYKTGDFDLSGYLGYSVNFYYELSDKNGEEERTIVFAEINEKRNKIVKVSAEDITGCENSEFFYEDANGNEKTVKVDKTSDVIYNGKRITDYTDETFEIKAGYITFINNNSDSIYDVIDIVEYQNYAVKIFDASNKKIYDKYDSKKSLTLDDDIETLIVEDLDGAKMSYTSIAKNNVLTTVKSKDGTYVKIMVSTKTISGTVEGIKKSDSIKLRIDGEEYAVAASYKDYYEDEIKVGTKAVFSLDAEGKIAAADLTAGTVNYGYVVSAKEVTKGFDTDVYFRIFGTDGEMKDLISAKTMTVNDETGLTGTEIFDEIEPLNIEYTVISYELDSYGNVKKIFTAGDNLDFGIYKIQQTVSSELYKTEQRSFGGKLTMSSNASVFIVPSDKSRLEDYKISTHNLFQLDSRYTVEGYSFKRNGAYADAVIYESAVADLNDGSSYLLIENFGETVDNDGMACDSIIGYSLGTAGGRSGYSSVEIGVLDEVSLSGFAEGDVIQYATDADGKIKEAKLMFDYSAKSVVATNGNSSGYELARRVQYGKVYHRDEDLVRVTSDTITSDSTETNLNLLNFIASTFTIVTYDSTSRSEKITSGSYADILDYKTVGGNCTNVLVITTWARPTAFVIYK